MQDEFRVIEQKILVEEKKLIFQAEGKLVHRIVNNKLRVIMVFQCGKKQRRFPLNTICFRNGEQTCFAIREEIWLEHIFYPSSLVKEEDNVQIFFEYYDNRGEQHVLPNKMSLDSEMFRVFQTKEHKGYRAFRKVLYVICTMMLPFWLLDGWFVTKGVRKSEYVGKEVRGKRAMIYHAHGIVKHLTGYGYSMREYKTNYFAKKYDQYVRCNKTTKGILFLSERICEKGGNLDLIRTGIAETGKEWQQFIDVRPIHKLPKSEIRKVAKMAAKAKVIILEDFYPQIHAIALRKETKLIQLWHACGAFKMFGLSELGKVEHLTQDTKNHRNYSIALVSGHRMVPFYSEAFGISPEQVKALGIPRTDIFFDHEYKEKITQVLYDKYPVLKDKKIVLFAPTFRGSGNKTAYYPVERFVVDSFLESVSEDTVLIIKNHPFVKDQLQYSAKYQNRVVDLSTKENINDILFITDLLITDYSSCIFEAALLHTPMLFYVFDLEEYIRERDFYFDFSSMTPGIRVDTFEGVKIQANRILEGKAEQMDKKEERFVEYFLDCLDGNSTKRVLDLVKELEEMPN